METIVLQTILVELGLLLVLQPAASLISGQCNSYEREKLNEGYYECTHRDTATGMASLGVGFNLYGYQAEMELDKVGANYTRILNGSECLNETQIKELFKLSMADAVECASNFMYKAWATLSIDAQSAIADMAFDYHYIGCEPVYRIQDFVDLRVSLSETPPDYNKAANILQVSTWCGQEPMRCHEAMTCIQSSN